MEMYRYNQLKFLFDTGSGPGGQSINKTANNVQLLHKPSGIRVTCQETRSLQQNRLIARKKLLEKVLVLPFVWVLLFFGVRVLI